MPPECCPDKIGMLSACFRNRVRMLSDYCPHVAGITVRIRPEYALRLLYQLEQCEEYIANEKTQYNIEVSNYNYIIYSFPFVLLREGLGFQSIENVFLSNKYEEITDEMLGI